MSNSHSKPISVADQILERSGARRRQQEQAEREAEAARLPMEELRNAVLEFSEWRSLQGTPEASTEQFIVLAEQLRCVIERHHFDDFYDLIKDSEWSGDFSEQHADACALLLHLLKLPLDDAYSEVIRVVKSDECVAQRVTIISTAQLSEIWYRDFNNIYRLPQDFTLYDLPEPMTKEGCLLLVRKHPLLGEVVEEMRKDEPDFELYPNGIRHLIADLLFDGPTDPRRAATMTPEQVLRHLRAGNDTACDVETTAEGDNPPAEDKQPANPIQAEGGGPPAPARLLKPKGKGKNIDARMLKTLNDNYESHGWTALQWADRLDCSDGTIKGTKTWKELLKAARATAKADSVINKNRTSGNRKAKHNSQC